MEPRPGQRVNSEFPDLAVVGHAAPAFTMRTHVHGQDDAPKIAVETLQRVAKPFCHGGGAGRSRAFSARTATLARYPFLMTAPADPALRVTAVGLREVAQHCQALAGEVAPILSSVTVSGWQSSGAAPAR